MHYSLQIIFLYYALLQIIFAIMMHLPLQFVKDCLPACRWIFRLLR